MINSWAIDLYENEVIVKSGPMIMTAVFVHAKNVHTPVDPLHQKNGDHLVHVFRSSLTFLSFLDEIQTTGFWKRLSIGQSLYFKVSDRRRCVYLSYLPSDRPVTAEPVSVNRYNNDIRHTVFVYLPSFNRNNIKMWFCTLYVRLIYHLSCIISDNYCNLYATIYSGHMGKVARKELAALDLLHE